jgi:hypothetical protein
LTVAPGFIQSITIPAILVAYKVAEADCQGASMQKVAELFIEFLLRKMTRTVRWRLISVLL